MTHAEIGCKLGLMFNNDGCQAVEIILRKYGNSTVVVLPPALLKELRLVAGQLMTLNVTHDGTIILSRRRKFTLDELIAMCDTAAPVPPDLPLWEAAKPVGGELW